MSDNWFYARAGQQYGPVTTEALRNLLRSGQVAPNEFVWAEGMPNWMEAGAVPELRDVFFPQQAPPPSTFAGGYGVAPPPGAGGPAVMPNYYTPPNAIGAPEYAGFWLRFAAYLIDAVVTFIGGACVGGVIGFIIGAAMAAGGGGFNGDDPLLNVLFNLVGVVIGWIYYAVMESSSKQASLGKMAVGIMVTDLDGARITFGRATGRYFGKIVSAIILGIGFMMAGWTPRKQALHDSMAGTLVVRGRR